MHAWSTITARYAQLTSSMHWLARYNTRLGAVCRVKSPYPERLETSRVDRSSRPGCRYLCGAPSNRGCDSVGKRMWPVSSTHILLDDSRGLLYESVWSR